MMTDIDLPKLMDGSVKTIYGRKDTAPYIFEFSDRYSIFDWGPMPNGIVQKGEALTFFTDFFFTYLGQNCNWENWMGPKYAMDDSTKKLLCQLQKNGVQHHGIGKVKKNRYAVNPVKVLQPEFSEKSGWNYSSYVDRPTQALVPLEVIFRFGCPEGSSLPKRLGKNPKYCEELGITTLPQTGDVFARPLIEFSTKLETSDRYIPYSEAKKLASLTDQEFTQLKDLTELLANRLKDVFSDIGVELWDGKFEFAFSGQMEGNGDERDFMLVDSIGPDELRLTYKNISLSKENVRQIYHGSRWEKCVADAKKLASKRGVKDWKKICIDELEARPEKLSHEDIERLSMIYLSLANSLALKFSERPPFPEAWSLNTLMEKWS